MRIAVVAAAVCISVIGLATVTNAQAAARRATSITAQGLGPALQSLAKEHGFQLVYRSELIEGLRTGSITGDLTADEALTRLLAGTGLAFRYLDERTVTIFSPAADARGTPTSDARGSTGERGATGEIARALRLAQTSEPAATSSEEARRDDADGEADGEADDEVDFVRATADGIPEILVQAARFKTLNMDIRRTRDDAQPYVVFDRRQIVQSGASNIGEFLKLRLPMNSVAELANQVFGVQGNVSQVNLRGLGAGQTLILIDGHRASSPQVNGTIVQSDLNGIPLAAIERIEVLPATASGIYGGGATGGVVNVILRRDYSGIEANLNFEDSFSTGAENRRIDLNAGFTLEGGKTNLLLAGSYAEADPMLAGDNDLIRDYRNAMLANNPAVFSSQTTPPLGATPNIRSVNGSPLFGAGTPSFTFVPEGYAGGGGLAPLQANAGRYNLELPETAQPVIGRKAGLLAAPTAKSLALTVRRQFSDNVQAFLDSLVSDNESEIPSNGIGGFPASYVVAASAPNNPFGQAIRVSVPNAAADGSSAQSEAVQRRVIGGVIVQLPGQWRAEADYTWDRSRTTFSSALLSSGAEAAPIGNGTLDVLRDTVAFPLAFTPYLQSGNVNAPQRSVLKDAALRLAGPLWTLPGGPVQLSALLENRYELVDETSAFVNPTTDIIFPEKSQAIDSIYMELSAPIVSSRNAVPGVRELDLQLAGRWDEYRTSGATQSIVVINGVPLAQPILASNERSSINPTVGLRYRPFADLMVRASYGTGFLPPSLVQLSPGADFTLTSSGLTDPKQGGAPVGTITVGSGGNANLDPEESESWSAGVVFTPGFLSGLRVSVDYTHIEKTDNIFDPNLGTARRQTLIDNEDILPGAVVRDASGVITRLNAYLINISRAEIEAYDLALDYRLATGTLGTFDFFAAATRQKTFETQVAPTTPVIENVGTGSGNPLELKANTGLTWNGGGWTLGWAARYFDSYFVANPALATSATTFLNQGSRRVPSQTYHDVMAGYRFDFSDNQHWSSRWLNDTEVQLGVRNVFDEEPPLDAAFTVRLYSPFGDPRGASYYLTLKHAF